MKKKFFFISSLTIIAISSIVFFSCKKNKNGVSESNKSSIGNTMRTYPSFTNLDKVNDHLRHLAFGSASLFDLIYLSSSTTSDYISSIEKFINKEEVSFEKINSTIDRNIFKDFATSFSPVSYEKSMIDAIDWSNTDYRLYTPRPNIWTAYDWSALEGFELNSNNYFTLIRIPDWENLKNDPSRLSKPIVVVPNEEDINGDVILPIVGFTYDPINDKVEMISWATEEEFDDEEDYYIWVVDYDGVPLQTGSPYNACLGDNNPVNGDDYCDVDCGENENNSPADCNQAFLRKVWIEDLEIIEDYKQKCGTDYQWLESRLHGQYEIAYQCVVAHANGKSKARGGLLEEKWNRDEIKMTRKMGISCNFKSKGSSSYKMNVTPWIWWRDNQNTDQKIEEKKLKQPRAYLSENYKPWRDTIYLLIYEYDKPMPGRERSINVITRPGKTHIMDYTTRKNEGPFGDKTNTNSTVAFNSLVPINGALVPNAQVVMITPQSWPGFGLFSVPTDEFTINGVGSSNGANPNTYSIRVKLKYGM